MGEDSSDIVARWRAKADVRPFGHLDSLEAEAADEIERRTDKARRAHCKRVVAAEFATAHT